MSGKKRDHGAGFKAKAALAVLSAQYQVHQSQILSWKQQLPERAEETFGRGRKGGRDGRQPVGFLLPIQPFRQ